MPERARPRGKRLALESDEAFEAGEAVHTEAQKYPRIVAR
jgi:hypothetical protein